MTLKCKVEKRFVVNYGDLERFIAEKYELPKFCAIGECSNDSTIDLTVDDLPLEEWDQKTLAEALATRYVAHWSLSTVMQDMCNKGWIEPGDYLINVSW